MYLQQSFTKLYSCTMYPKDIHYHRHEEEIQTYEIARYESIESSLDQKSKAQFPQQQYPSYDEFSERPSSATKKPDYLSSEDVPLSPIL